MDILAYLAALMIGLSLGLLGGGGSILTVPVLVYLFGVDKVTSTAYSLFIVGATALGAIIPKAKQGLIDFKVALWFGAPSIAMVYATRKFIVPAIPEHIMSIGELMVDKGMALMLLFAVLMLLAARGMLKGHTQVQQNKDLNTTQRVLIILAEGAGVGLLTGLVGAGGGFLIIPALVLVTGLNMKVAVGTSLTIIAFKSLLGFTGDLGQITMDWPLLFSITGMALVGMLVGNLLTHRVNTASLKKAFGWFVLAMGILVIATELFSNN